MTCALVETISVCKRRDEEGISTICPKHKTSELAQAQAQHGVATRSLTLDTCMSSLSLTLSNNSRDKPVLALTYPNPARNDVAMHARSEMIRWEGISVGTCTCSVALKSCSHVLGLFLVLDDTALPCNGLLLRRHSVVGSRLAISTSALCRISIIPWLCQKPEPCHKQTPVITAKGMQISR